MFFLNIVKFPEFVFRIYIREINPFPFDNWGFCCPFKFLCHFRFSHES